LAKKSTYSQKIHNFYEKVSFFIHTVVKMICYADSIRKEICGNNKAVIKKGRHL